MTEVLERRGGTVIQFQGDALLATFNVPVADPGHARQAVRASQEMRAATRRADRGGAQPRVPDRRRHRNGGRRGGRRLGPSQLHRLRRRGQPRGPARITESRSRHVRPRLRRGPRRRRGTSPSNPAGTTTVRGQSVATRLFTVREKEEEEEETGRPSADDGQGPAEERRGTAGIVPNHASAPARRHSSRERSRQVVAVRAGPFGNRGPAGAQCRSESAGAPVGQTVNVGRRRSLRQRREAGNERNRTNHGAGTPRPGESLLPRRAGRRPHLDFGHGGGAGGTGTNSRSRSPSSSGSRSKRWTPRSGRPAAPDRRTSSR